MGMTATKAKENPYYKARIEAAQKNDRLKSRENAADMLGVSVSSLADYELGNTKVVPVDKVVLMADLYDAPELLEHYCANVCPIKKPEIKLQTLDRLTVSAMSNFRKIGYIKDLLLDITEDGVITKDEKPQLDEIIKTLDDLTNVSQEIKLWAKKYMEE